MKTMHGSEVEFELRNELARLLGDSDFEVIRDDEGFSGFAYYVLDNGSADIIGTGASTSEALQEAVATARKWEEGREDYSSDRRLELACGWRS